MKKKRQKSYFSKKSRKAKQQKKQQQQQQQQQHHTQQAATNEQEIIIPSNTNSTDRTTTVIKGAFNLPILSASLQKQQILNRFVTKISNQATIKRSKIIYISSHQLIGQLLRKSAIRSLDDKTKFLHNIEANVIQLLQQIFIKTEPTQTKAKVSSIENAVELPPLTREELESYTVDRSHLLFQRTTSSMDIKTFELTSCSPNQLMYSGTKSCANIFLNSLGIEATVPTKTVQKSRPSYLIEKDTHVFGGCVDDDADDEFFISSGAVYQSWPYVYEPGYQMQPLPQTAPVQLSMSDEAINYADTETEASNSHASEQPTELTTYSLHNYGINLFHVDDQTKAQKKKRRRRHRKDVTEFNSMSTSGSCFESDLTDDSSDDDSDSYRAYKERHAIGLNNFKFNNSQSSLSDLGNQPIGLGQFRTNLYHTDSSSCDEYSRLPSGKKRSHVLTARMATSFHTYEDSCFGDFSRNRNMFGRAKFSSYNHQCLSSNNLIF